MTAFVDEDTVVPAPRSCPVAHAPASAGPGLVEAATTFLEQFHSETTPAQTLAGRLDEVRREIDETGTYVHTPDELTFGPCSARAGQLDGLCDTF